MELRPHPSSWRASAGAAPAAWHIAQRRREERAGIQDDDGRIHAASVSEVEPLAFDGKFVQRSKSGCVLAHSVAEHVPDKGPAVGAHAAAGNAPI